MTKLATALSALPAGTRIDDMGEYYLARPPTAPWILIYKDGHTRVLGQGPVLATRK